MVRRVRRPAGGRELREETREFRPYQQRCVVPGQGVSDGGRGKFALLEPNQPGPQAAWPGRPIDAAGGIPRFDGDTLVFTNRPLRRIETFDLADPDAPKKIKSRCYGLASYPEGVSFWKHRIVIPAGYGGLLLERRAPKP